MYHLSFLGMTSRQRQISFYRFITFVSLSLSFTLFSWHNSDWKLTCIPAAHYEKLEVSAVRKVVLEENMDEFLEDVLRELTFFEVDLDSTTHLDSGHAKIYDKIIESDINRVKPDLGQNGTNLKVPSESIPEADKAIKEDGFNTILSEMISVNRTVPDNREAACRNISYDVTSLPTLSVIIIYSEEPFSAIIRTVHSVINRTPPSLLQEVILVDDFSFRLELQHKLERYLATHFPRNKVRLLKISNKRGGLIRARMIGAHVATGDILIFLDAHCEVNQMWAEPLLERIKEKENTVVAPVIDVINKETMEYERDETGYVHVGGFSWNGLFYWIKIPDYERRRKRYHHEPTRTPVIAGGLFAIDRKYFWEIGSYDSGMTVWGGENVEISLRVWQCGGSMEIIPCSRVGHIFRARVPYKYPTDYDPIGVNTARVAEVWMDEYKELFYKHRFGQVLRHGDIRKRVALRKRLQCKSFQWYLDNVYSQKFQSYFESKYFGQVRNPETNLCLDDMQNEAQATYFLELFECQKKLSRSQLFYLSKGRHLRKEFVCASLSLSTPDNNQVEMRDCEQEDSNDPDLWQYSQKHHFLIHKNSSKCLTMMKDGNKTKATLETCQSNSSNQYWEFKEG